MRCKGLTVLATWVLAFPPAVWAAGSVTGTVTDRDGGVVPGVTVVLDGRSTVTDGSGRYAFGELAAGTVTVTASLSGFRTERRVVNVPADGEVAADFVLVLDLLLSESVVVTGTRNPLTKKESSVAITTLTQRQIEARAPRNTADVLHGVPGFYVESSGGQVGNNLWARGLPADGSYRYVALTEDGMPVYDATELFFVNADIFVRVDENVAELEAIRGGNAALFGSNAPGGVVNFLSQTGGDAPRTALNLQGGTDGMARVGLNTSGPVGQEWSYSVGGFYRYDRGVRDPGFPASRGGQVKWNVTRRLESGYVRVYGKHLADSNIFYLPLPFKAGGDFVDGFPKDGTLATPEANHVTVPRPNQEGRLRLPLEDGQRQVGHWLMAELATELPGGFRLESHSRVMDVDHAWNALVPFDLTTPAAFASPFVPAGGRAEFSFTNHDQPFAVSNDLLLTAGLWRVEKPLASFASQLQVSKEVATDAARHQLTAGAYLSHYRADNRWFFNDVLTDVRHQPRFVDLTVVDAGGRRTAVTAGGFRRFGSTYVNASGNVDVAAVFASDTVTIADRLRLDLGIRIETNRYRQTEENTASFDLGDAATLADDAVAGGLGTFRRATQSFTEWAASLGVNYSASDDLALWARGSRGFKMPILDNYLFGGRDLETEGILQLEAGVKLGGPRLSLDASAYFLRLEDFPSQDARVVDGQTVFVTAFVGRAETVGAEAELVVEPVPRLRAALNLTLQRPEYLDFVEGGQDFSGNRIRRVPRIVSDLSVGYYGPRASVTGSWNHIGARFSNNANTIDLPAYDVFGFRGSYTLSSAATLSLAVQNAFDSTGLTEGNPRLDESAVAAGLVFLARPVLPRRVTLALELDF